jgi:hypothetical protein
VEDEEIANIVASAGLEPFFSALFPPGPTSFPLTGTRITVVNAKQSDGLNVQLNGVPSLTTYAPGMKLRRDLIQSRVPLCAGDCVIDINHGRITAGEYPEGGIYTVWTVETDGDPELLFEKDDREQRSVRIPSQASGPAQLRIRNGTPDLCNKQFDFALYYLAAVGGINEQWFARWLPGETPPALGFVDTTTSCSNSQYP